jgi:hypothetical protein
MFSAQDIFMKKFGSVEFSPQTQNDCGSEPAREEGVSGNINIA